MNRKVELLAPAGDLEKLKMAVIYGADAVYLAGTRFGLRTASDNFTPEEMTEGIAFCHEHGKKAYLTMNIIPHNKDIRDAREFLDDAVKAGIDAVIVSDPGTFNLVRNSHPELPIHISTQANTTNFESVKFWHQLGASRVVLARELSLEEIREIHESIPDGCELEVFVHGAMCISYSGRCLLSNYMAGRDSNMGDCAHPCRWRYALVEEKRPGQYYPIEETERGTFIFNSKDLCMVKHIPELIASGVHSLKIEGRVKSAFYVATVVKAYREAIDAYYEGVKEDPDEWYREISKVSNRDFTTGFFFKKPTSEDHNYGTSSYIRGYDFVGVVKGYDSSNQLLIIEQRNRFATGDLLEISPPSGKYSVITAHELFDGEGNKIDAAPHPQMEVRIRCASSYPGFSIVRRKAKD